MLVVVGPSLVFRGQGRDVHPQLLVSQRQTQELRLDNQLRTSEPLPGSQVSSASIHKKNKKSEFPSETSLPPLAEAQFDPPAWIRLACMDGRSGRSSVMSGKAERKSEGEKALTHACLLCG